VTDPPLKPSSTEYVTAAFELPEACAVKVADWPSKSDAAWGVIVMVTVGEGKPACEAWSNAGSGLAQAASATKATAKTR
jgi:hypothetical protein